MTITLAATSAVADAATGSKAGLIWAMITGLATAAPAAEEAATPAVPFPPPISRSAIISGIPVMIITATPRKIPSRPVSIITFRLMVLPSAKPKKGISTGVALLKKARRSWSRLPRAKPIRNGSTAPTKWCGSNEARPAEPRITMVISGPDSSDINTNAPDSSLLPYWFIRLA